VNISNSIDSIILNIGKNKEAQVILKLDNLLNALSIIEQVKKLKSKFNKYYIAVAEGFGRDKVKRIYVIPNKFVNANIAINETLGNYVAIIILDTQLDKVKDRVQIKFIDNSIINVEDYIRIISITNTFIKTKEQYESYYMDSTQLVHNKNVNMQLIRSHIKENIADLYIRIDFKQ